MNWNLSEAKNRLSEVLTRADAEAQTIVRRDRLDELEPMNRKGVAMRNPRR